MQGREDAAEYVQIFQAVLLDWQSADDDYGACHCAGLLCHLRKGAGYLYLSVAIQRDYHVHGIVLVSSGNQCALSGVQDREKAFVFPCGVRKPLGADNRLFGDESDLALCGAVDAAAYDVRHVFHTGMVRDMED